MADPGFSVLALVRGEGTNHRRRRLLAKMYVKTKELGSVGGVRRKILCVDSPLTYTIKIPAMTGSILMANVFTEYIQLT